MARAEAVRRDMGSSEFLLALDTKGKKFVYGFAWAYSALPRVGTSVIVGLGFEAS